MKRRVFVKLLELCWRCAKQVKNKITDQAHLIR